jgi:hypothetical protein
MTLKKDRGIETTFVGRPRQPRALSSILASDAKVTLYSRRFRRGSDDEQQHTRRAAV